MSEKLNMIGGLPKELGVFETIEKSTKTSITVYTTQKRFKKLVTIIEGLQGKELDSTAKELKRKLACGGSSKNGIVVLQGDHREKVVEYLVEMGYPKEAIKVTHK